MKKSTIVNEMGRFKIYELKEFFKSGKWKLYKEDEFNKNWNNKKKSKLIESLLLNIPIIHIKLNEYEFSKYEILDGREIVKTILEFMSEKLKLEGLEILSELNGLTYNNLPEKEKKYIYIKNIRFIYILDVSEDMKDNVFKRFQE